MRLRIHDQELDLREGQGALTLDGETVPVTLLHRRTTGESVEVALQVGASHRRYWVTPQPDGSWLVQTPGGARASAAPAGKAGQTRGPYGPVPSPMAGVVTAVHVEAGQAVAKGAPLAVVEAMKMRFTLEAEAEGVITEVLVVEKALVTMNQVLFHLAP